MNTQHNQHVTDFMNSDRFDVEAYVDKFITDYNRACYESGNVDKQVQVETLERASMSFWHTDETIRNNTRRYK